MTRSLVWHDSFVSVRWRSHTRVTRGKTVDTSRASSRCAFTERLRWVAPHVCARWVRECDVTHLWVWRDLFMSVTWLIHQYDSCEKTADTSRVFLRCVFSVCRWVLHDSFTSMTWLIHVCDVTYSWLWRDSFMHVKWLIHEYDTCENTTDASRAFSRCAFSAWHRQVVSHMCSVCHHTCVVCVIECSVCHTCVVCVVECEITHSQVWHDSFTSVTWLIHKFDTWEDCWHV